MKFASRDPTTRIVATAVALLAVTSVIVGAAVIGVMQDRLRTAISGVLADKRESSSRLFISLVELRESQMQFVATRPGLKKSLREIASGRDVARETANVRTILQSFVEAGFRGLAYTDGSGRELARVGGFTEKSMQSVRLATALESELAWMDGFILIARITISDAQGPLGTVVAEQSLPLLTQLMAQGENLGKTGEMALCFPKGDGMACFPQRFRPRPYELPLYGSDNRPLPMTHALWGKSGLVEARDYREQQVIAAYGPVGILGLGMVVKMDAAELLGPARTLLLLVLAGCALLIAGGALLVRRQVRPIAMQMAQAEDEARQARDRLQFIADNMPSVVAYVDAGERYRFVSRIYEQWYGASPQDIMGRPLREVMGTERYPAAKPYVDQALLGKRVEFEATIVTPGGARTLHTTYLPDRGPDGILRGFFVLSNDISRLAEARTALAKTKQRLDLALDASRVTVWETDVRTGDTVLSEAWAEFLDRPPGETRTTVVELAALVHPTELAELKRLQVAAIIGKNDAYSVEHRVRAASGHWKWVLSRGQVVERDPASGRALRMVGTNLDITARKAAELRMEHLATYDTLTGAANRALFGDRLARAIVRNRRTRGTAALMYLDIDKFKGVNDSLGHPAGDALLMEFAARLRACVRATDTVGRLGGDEFALLLEDLTEANAVTRVADKILEAMRRPLTVDGHSLVITTSMGIVVFGAEAADGAEALAKRADAALYAAKAAGRDTYRLAA